jgi:hypothetical protein
MVDDLYEAAESARRSVEVLLELGGSAATSVVEQAVHAAAHLADNSLRVLSKRTEASGVDARHCGSCAIGAIEALFKSRLVEGAEYRAEVERAHSYLRDAKCAARPKADEASA